jgi:toxin HigB-1
MIRSFADRATERLFRDGTCPARWRSIEAIVLRKLDMVDAATRLDDLLSPPGNRLEALKGDRRGQHPYASTGSSASASVGRPTGPRR